MRFHWNENIRKYRSGIIIIVILFILFCYTCFHISDAERVKIGLEEESSDLKSHQLINYEKRIEFLTSVLRRFKVSEEEFYDQKLLPTIFIITPTYARPLQKAELTRLKNVFLLVPSIHWILVEDSNHKTKLVESFLSTSGIPFTHLFKLTPPEFKLLSKEKTWKKPRGVWQRNEGIQWLRDTYNVGEKGVVYFADDDNTYSIELFKEMRWTTRVSVWPVALVGGLLLEHPIVEYGLVVGWKTGYLAAQRRFATDMAGFGVNLSLLLSTPSAFFIVDKRPGFLETNFLNNLVTMEDLEPMAELCTKVYVWHTRTETPLLDKEMQFTRRGKASNYGIEI